MKPQRFRPGSFLVAISRRSLGMNGPTQSSITKQYRFPCGCQWPILEEVMPDGQMPLLDFDVERAPGDCPATWAMLGRGETKGVFQLESALGRQWTRKLKPE